MKTQLNEELDSIKYLFGYQRGRVISEQKTYYRDIFGKVGVVDGTINKFRPLGSREITLDEFKSSGGIDLFSGINKVSLNIPKLPQTPQVAQEPQLDQVVLEPQVVQQPQVAQQPQVNTSSTATNIQNKLVELGRESMLGPTGVDGKIGPNTINAIWDTIKDIQK